jgi:sarcosine oxidase subunit delta
MRIPCPYCGARDSREFSYLGDATVRRPAHGASQDAWFEYVYLRENPAGPHREYWYHAQGCRSWLTVTRDTRTHEILGAVLGRADAT